MPSKADIEEPISLVRPMHARTVQAILDRAHQQERSANERVQQTVANNLRAGRSKGDLSKALGLVLSHHGRTRKGGPSIRPVAPDSGGRAFHFAQALDRGADHRLAEPMPAAGQGLGMPQPKRAGIPAVGVSAADAPTPLQQC